MHGRLQTGAPLSDIFREWKKAIQWNSQRKKTQFSVGKRELKNPVHMRIDRKLRTRGSGEASVRSDVLFQAQRLILPYDVLLVKRIRGEQRGKEKYNSFPINGAGIGRWKLFAAPGSSSVERGEGGWGRGGRCRSPDPQVSARSKTGEKVATTVEKSNKARKRHVCGGTTFPAA